MHCYTGLIDSSYESSPCVVQQICCTERALRLVAGSLNDSTRFAVCTDFVFLLLHAHDERFIRFSGSQKSVSHAGESHISFDVWDFSSVCFDVSSFSSKNGKIAFLRDNA